MRFVAGRGTGAERHREDVAGRGAVAAEMLLSRTLLAEKTQGCIGKLLLAEAPWRLRCCWQDAAGREDARRNREDAAGRGRLNGPLLL